VTILTAALMLLLSIPTFAEMSAGTVVIGNKAYSLDYANDKANSEEIRNSVEASQNKIYIKDFTGNWIDNISGTPVQVSVIPEVSYKDKSNIKNFLQHDGNFDVSALSVKFESSPDKVVAVGQALVEIGTVTFTAGSSNAEVTGLKLVRSGLSKDSDVKRITIWDGLNRLNSYGQISDNISDIYFTSPLTISSGQNKTISIKVSISDTASPEAQIKLSMPDKDAIKTTQSVKLTLPTASCTMTVVPAP
jgi:hypothetical protein